MLLPTCNRINSKRPWITGLLTRGVVVIAPYFRLGGVGIDFRRETKHPRAIIAIAVKQQLLSTHGIQNFLQFVFVVKRLLRD